MVTVKPTLDIAAVVGIGGGRSIDEDNDPGYKGLWSPGGFDLGIYAGPGLSFGKYVGPHIGVGHLFGQNGFLAFSIGGHALNAVGLGIVIPFFPTYDRTGTTQGAMVDSLYRSDLSLYDGLYNTANHLSTVSEYVQEYPKLSTSLAVLTAGMYTGLEYFRRRKLE